MNNFMKGILLNYCFNILIIKPLQISIPMTSLTIMFFPSHLEFNRSLCVIYFVD